MEGYKFFFYWCGFYLAGPGQEAVGRRWPRTLMLPWGWCSISPVKREDVTGLEAMLETSSVLYCDGGSSVLTVQSLGSGDDSEPFHDCSASRASGNSPLARFGSKRTNSGWFSFSCCQYLGEGISCLLRWAEGFCFCLIHTRSKIRHLRD